MTSNVLRAYSIGIAVVCAAAIAIALYQQQQASQWQREVDGWRIVAKQSVVSGRKAVRRERRMAIRYNRLVRSTTRSQRRLLDQLKRASQTPATVYRTASTGTVPASTSTSVPAPVAAPTPTTRAS